LTQEKAVRAAGDPDNWRRLTPDAVTLGPSPRRLKNRTDDITLYTLISST